MSDEEITRVKVHIMGEEYVLRGDSSPEHIRRVANLVDKRMQAIAYSQPQLNQARVAIMTALALADELLQLSGEEPSVIELKKHPKAGRSSNSSKR